MFLVEDQRHDTPQLVFTWQDPRKDGYRGAVVEDVHLDYDMHAVHRWPDGQPRPEAAVGRAAGDPKHYKVFQYAGQLRAEGYQPVPGTAVVFGSWSDYLKLRLDPPDPEQVGDELWFDYLDEIDEKHRHWSNSLAGQDSPTGGNRDEVAAWVAKRHFVADSSIREVWYLPRGAPPDEIRLLELNDRLGGREANAEAIDFGLDVEGARFHLLVADVSSDQLEGIKGDPSRLPKGWSLDGKQVWPRRRRA